MVWLLAPPSSALVSSVDSSGQADVTVATGLGVFAAAVVGDVLGVVARGDGPSQLAVWLAVEHPASSASTPKTGVIRRIRRTHEHSTLCPTKGNGSDKRP